MDRAAGFYPAGWGFESLRARLAQSRLLFEAVEDRHAVVEYSGELSAAHLVDEEQQAECNEDDVADDPPAQ